MGHFEVGKHKPLMTHLIPSVASPLFPNGKVTACDVLDKAGA